MSFRDDVDALAARHSSLEQELAAKTRELDGVARDLGEAREKQRKPQLDNLRIATPCSQSWDQMLGDDRVRHCGECKKNVYNFSDMTRDEVETLLIEKNGDVCARYYQRADGTILLADCLVGIRKRRRRRVVAAGAAALLASGAGYFVTQRGAASRTESRDESTMVGALVEEPASPHFAQPPSAHPAEPSVYPEPPPPPHVVPLVGAVRPMPMPAKPVAKKQPADGGYRMGDVE